MAEKKYSCFNQNTAAYGFILLQSLLYGIGDPISKLAFDVLPVYSILSVRYLIAFAVFMMIFGKHIIEDLHHASRAWIPPSICIASSFVLSNLALSMTAATSMAFLRSMTTLITPILAWALYRRGLKKAHLLIYAVMLAGLYFLCGPGSLTGFGPGEILALTSSLLSACALVFGEIAVREIRPATLSAMQALFSAILASLCALLIDGGWQFTGSGPAVWSIIIYLALACTGAGYLLQNLAMTRISARTVALLQCIYPVLTMCMSFLILGERLSIAGLMGAVLILCSIIGEILLKD